MGNKRAAAGLHAAQMWGGNAGYSSVYVRVNSNSLWVQMIRQKMGG